MADSLSERRIQHTSIFAHRPPFLPLRRGIVISAGASNGPNWAKAYDSTRGILTILTSTILSLIEPNNQIFLLSAVHQDYPSNK